MDMLLSHSTLYGARKLATQTLHAELRISAAAAAGPAVLLLCLAKKQLPAQLQRGSASRFR